MVIRMTGALALLLSVSAGSSQTFTGTPHPEWVGKSVNDLNLPFSNKATAYVFAQPDCASCSLQLAALASLQKSQPNLQVVLVTEQNSAALKDYLNGFSLKLNVYADTEGKSIAALGLRKIPALLLADVQGKVQGFYEGSLTGAETKDLGSALAIGQAVPQLTVPGGVGSPAASLPGVTWANSKNNLLIFHNLTCHFCTEELPYLVTYAKAHPDINVWIIAPSDIEAVKKQFADAGGSANIQVIENAADKDAGIKLFDAYRANGTPTQILVSDAGLIRWRGEGFALQGANPFEGERLPLE